MARKNKLMSAPPFAVETTLQRLGAHLRMARVRRNLTREDVAAKIGAGVRAITDAEKGKPATSVGIYAALLWTFGMVGQLDGLADPTQDKEGLAMLSAEERTRAGKRNVLDNDF